MIFEESMKAYDVGESLEVISVIVFNCRLTINRIFKKNKFMNVKL